MTARRTKRDINLDVISPSISVVVPIYYRPVELSRLLDSILKQTKKPMEIIIVDDTPNPLIKLICEQYENDFQEIGVHLYYIKNPKERSISTARNLGAKLAKGNIVLFVDSDVILTTGHLRGVQNAFEKHSEALGVEGTILPLIPPPTGVRENAVENIKKLFFIFHRVRNTCKHFEIPTALDRDIQCQYFDGNSMAFKQGVFNQFQFDETLVQYSYMETVLFTGLIDKTNPGQLFRSPEAKFYHEVGRKGRMEKSELRIHKLRCRKYVMTELFGYRGLLMFGWQNLGLLVLRIIGRIRNKDFTSAML